MHSKHKRLSRVGHERYSRLRILWKKSRQGSDTQASVAPYLDSQCGGACSKQREAAARIQRVPGASCRRCTRLHPYGAENLARCRLASQEGVLAMGDVRRHFRPLSLSPLTCRCCARPRVVSRTPSGSGFMRRPSRQERLSVVRSSARTTYCACRRARRLRKRSMPAYLNSGVLAAYTRSEGRAETPEKRVCEQRRDSSAPLAGNVPPRP